METECVHLPRCGFFLKFCKTKDLACRGFIARYCKGDLMKDCKRLQYKNEHGVPPSDDMMPTGQTISGAK